MTSLIKLLSHCCFSSVGVGWVGGSMYLINKHAPLGWFAVQWEDVQVSSGGEARLHHRKKSFLRDTCDLGTDG